MRSWPASILAFAVLCLPLAASGQPPVNAQGATTAVFPDVHNKAIRYQAQLSAADGVHAPLAPVGQEGYGRTVIEVVGTAEDDSALALRLYSKLEGSPVGALSGIAPSSGSTTIDVSALGERAEEGRYTAKLTADNAFGAIARTRWASGAGSAYEAPATGATLLLPIMAVNTGSQSSVLAAQNAGDTGIQVGIQASDPLTGETLLANQVSLGANQGTEWDTAVERFIFDPDLLKPNVDGGFLGPLRINSGGSTALINYIDERDGPATAAVVARPVSAANAIQILPRVRSAADGGSLVAIANASLATIQVIVRFEAEADTDGAPPERMLTILGNGAAYIDLSPGGRSLPAAPAVPPFVGSATITATGPILAAAMEDWRAGGTVDALAGYNAFGPRDLSDRWAVPMVRRATDYVSSLIIVHNPTMSPASGSIQLADANGAPAVVVDLDIPAGASRTIDLSETDAFPIGRGSAMIEASAPVAVVSYEIRDTSREYPVVPLEVGLEDERGSNVEGTAMLTPSGTDLRVEIALAAGPGGGSSYSAFVMKAGCTEQDSPAAYPLSDVIGGRSVSMLSGVDLRTIADGFHAIRLKRAGGGPFSGRIACGIIGEVRGVEVADSAAVRGIQLSEGPAAIPTAAPTQGATASPSPTAASSPAPTRTAAAVTPSTPGLWVASVFMPAGHTGQ